MSAIAAASALLMAAPANAAEEHSAGLWHLSHLSDPVTGKFNYCAVESTFDNGLTLAFARNRDFNTNIVVSFPDKRLQDHSRYKMLVVVDTNPARDMDAFSADPTILVVPLQHDRKLLDWLQKGKLLELKGPQDSVKFALDGANDAFHKLQTCVEQGLKDETAHVADPVQAAKDRQVATAEAAQPLAPGMVMPLPLPVQTSVTPAADAPVAKPVAEIPAQTAAAAPDAPVPQPAPVAQAATPAAVPAQPSPPAPEVPAMAQAAPSSPAAATGVSPSMQHFLDKRQPQQEATASPETVAPSSQPTPQPQPAVSIAPPDRPAEPALQVAPQSAAAQPQPAAAKPAAPAKAAIAPANLPSNAAVLKLAGIKPSGKCSDTSASCTWRNGAETGSIMKASIGKSLLDTMLDDADSREKSCRGKFSAENSAPVARNGIESAAAMYTCNDMVEAGLYAKGADRALVFVDRTPADKKSLASATRQKIASSIGIAANYQ